VWADKCGLGSPHRNVMKCFRTAKFFYIHHENPEKRYSSQHIQAGNALAAFCGGDYPGGPANSSSPYSETGASCTALEPVTLSMDLLVAGKPTQVRTPESSRLRACA
jgi:hypothetical protein